MPCYEPREPEPEVRDLVTKLNQRTEQLCLQLTFLESIGQHQLIISSIRQWWKEHKKFDCMRRSSNG